MNIIKSLVLILMLVVTANTTALGNFKSYTFTCQILIDEKLVATPVIQASSNQPAIYAYRNYDKTDPITVNLRLFASEANNDKLILRLMLNILNGDIYNADENIINTLPGTKTELNFANARHTYKFIVTVA